MREAYDDIVDPDMEDEDEFEYCFKNRFPDFVHDFEKTQQLFVKNVRKGREWMYEWTPCEWEDCQESDTVLLRAHSLAPCDIVRMEEDALFFDLVDNTDSSSHIIGAYFIWPLDPKLNGYLRYLHQDYKNPGSGFPVLTASSWTGGRDRFPRLSLSTPNFQAMCMIKPLKAGVEIEYHALEMLGLEVKE